MPRNPKVITDKAIPAVLRRRFSKISDRDRPGPSRKERSTTRRSIVRKHRNELRDLLNKNDAREFTALKKQLANSSRSVRLREVDKFLCRTGYDRRRAHELIKGLQKELSNRLDEWEPRLPIRFPLPGRCSPTVVYPAPFPADFIHPYVELDGSFSTPVITPYINHLTGDIGSYIEAGILDADNDDDLYIDYYTAFRLLHTTIATGKLAIDLDFTIGALHLEGIARDEWGTSNLTARQSVYACIRVSSVVLPDEYLQERILNHMDVYLGEDDRWLAGDEPGLQRSYPFITESSFPQGTTVILEVGVSNQAEFGANDMHFQMTTDARLKLERVRVRSCP